MLFIYMIQTKENLSNNYNSLELFSNISKPFLRDLLNYDFICRWRKKRYMYKLRKWRAIGLNYIFYL